ncbi:FHA domain-containing protein [bacterium]|nr:FHA domain-containing protein [bacterium]
MPWECCNCGHQSNDEWSCSACGSSFPKIPKLTLPDGKERFVGEGEVIGNKLFLSDPRAKTVSSAHVRIYFHDSGWVVTNIHKKLPAYYNGSEIKRFQRLELESSGTIKVGEIEIPINLVESPPAEGG